MGRHAAQILEVLDRCCDAFTFPMLDNGYVYLAATRLSLYRSSNDWAMVIEVFGFSPRAGLPDTHIHTFGSRLQNSLTSNPNNESRFIYPVEEGDWHDQDNAELLTPEAANVVVRGRAVALPTEPAPVHVFELCRHLADVARDEVLATADERKLNVPTDLVQLLQLEEWNHPNVVDASQRPSGSATFQQLARVLETGDVESYRPLLPANTHWSNWPDGGSL